MECPTCKKKYALNYKGYCCKGCYKKSPKKDKRNKKEERHESMTMIEWESLYMECEKTLDDETKKVLMQSDITGMDLFVDNKKQGTLWRNPYNH